MALFRRAISWSEENLELGRQHWSQSLLSERVVRTTLTSLVKTFEAPTIFLQTYVLNLWLSMISPTRCCHPMLQQIADFSRSFSSRSRVRISPTQFSFSWMLLMKEITRRYPLK